MVIFIKVLSILLLLVIAVGLIALICRLQMKYPSIFCEYYPDYSDLLKRPNHGENGSDTVLDASKSACRDEQDDSKQSSKG